MKRPNTIHRKVCDELNQLRLSGALPPKWAKIITDQLNAKPREKLIKSNYVSQVGSGKFYNEEIAAAIYFLAENNKAKDLLDLVQEFLSKKSQETYLIISFCFCSTFLVSAQTGIDKTIYHPEPAFAERLQNYTDDLCQITSIPDKYHVHGYPTRLRITEVEKVLGYDATPIQQRIPVNTNVYYRPFENRKATDFYLALTTKTRMLSVSLIAKWEGEYFIEVVDPQSPALLRYDTRSQTVEIYHQCRNNSTEKKIPATENKTPLIDQHLSTFGNTWVDFRIFQNGNSICGGFTQGAFSQTFVEDGEYDFVFTNGAQELKITYLFENAQPIHWRASEVVAMKE